VAYKPSEARYDLGGSVKYLVYQTPQRLANGRVQMRTRVKRVYFPGDAKNITVGEPGSYRNLRGRKVFGVPVTYRYVLTGEGEKAVSTLPLLAKDDEPVRSHGRQPTRPWAAECRAPGCR
jgi:hypothetical protein